MYVVDPIAGKKIEYFIFSICFRSPSLAESINQRARFLNGPADVMLKLIAQIIIGAGKIVREQSHFRPIKKIASYKIERLASGLALQRAKSERQISQAISNRMREIVIHKKKKL